MVNHGLLLMLGMPHVITCCHFAFMLMPMNPGDELAATGFIPKALQPMKPQLASDSSGRDSLFLSILHRFQVSIVESYIVLNHDFCVSDRIG